ncbi:MAG: hypothetical protein ACD_7C00500G0005 [uncultured bacterium]|nr:MAG: hypothetical protein ACD_7C00500G0005 [uncultured bacterium]
MIKLVSTVGFFIVNEENKILLIKQCDEEKKDVSTDGKLISLKEESENILEEKWMVPSGNLEENDNPRAVIKKEVKKCLNCEVTDCNYFNLYFYDISDNFIKKIAYFYGTIEGEIKTKNEQMSVKWVSLDKKEIDGLNLIPEQKEALNDFLVFFQNKSLGNAE